MEMHIVIKQALLVRADARGVISVYVLLQYISVYYFRYLMLF